MNTTKKIAMVTIAMLMLTGCSSLKDYTFNGVPIEKLYVESGQAGTDATIDNSSESFCEANPAACIVGGAAVIGGTIWIIEDYNKKQPLRFD